MIDLERKLEAALGEIVPPPPPQQYHSFSYTGDVIFSALITVLTIKEILGELSLAHCIRPIDASRTPL